MCVYVGTGGVPVWPAFPSSPRRSLVDLVLTGREVSFFIGYDHFFAFVFSVHEGKTTAVFCVCADNLFESFGEQSVSALYIYFSRMPN